ncbi:MAG TPA: phosphodiester glycosidase family protein [Verrucomicrobiota bacterium]|nr:phosphodiester glycosidase family protein [Verrucomicrobiota bacterium]
MKHSQLWLIQILVVIGLSATALAQTFKDAGNGLSWREDRIPSEPWLIQIVRIERARGDLELVPTLAQGDRIGLNTLTGQLRLVSKELGEPLAAINGDFYDTEDEPFPGDPRGLFITRGELVSAPAPRDCFWIDRAGKPHIGIVRSGFQLTWPDGAVTPFGLNEDSSDAEAVLFTRAAGKAAELRRGNRVVLERAGDGPWLPLRVGETYLAKAGTNSGVSTSSLVLAVSSKLRGQIRQLSSGGTVQISTKTIPDLTGVTTAIGGGPALVRGGKALAVRALKSNERHPRSALGWNAQYYFFVVVDGRQESSDGMTLPELGAYLAKLGCEEAMNLDGGGSTELWLRGRILNRPCYGQERRMATGLAVIRTPAKTNSPASKQ